MIPSGIYKITLKYDDRCYIGSAKNIYRRWMSHKSNSLNTGAIQYIARALAKYGIDAFRWEILEEVEIDKLLEREQYYLDILQPFPWLNRGFNIREIADSNLGITFSEEAKTRMKGRTPWNKGKTYTYEELYGEDQAYEIKEEMSKNRKGENNSFYGNQHTDKTREQMSQTRKEKIKSGEIIPAKHTNEWKKNQSIRSKGENNSAAKEFLIIEPSGEKYKIKSLKTWCDEKGFSRSTFTNILKRNKTPNRGPAKGWFIERI